MKKYIILGIIMICELYGIAISGYLYSINNSPLNLFLLIGICIITFIGSLIDISILKEKKQPTKAEKECPYFIEGSENDLHK